MTDSGNQPGAVGAIAGQFRIDGQTIDFIEGETVLAAARRAGVYIPHLCWHPDFPAHGSCRICTVRVGERFVASCTTRAAPGLEVRNNVEDVRQMRQTLLQMLFVEGNHFCPSCEKSGQCVLQASAYYVGMVAPHFDEFYPTRNIDASHPELMLDRDRCIACGLCVRASALVDGKSAFAIGGHGMGTSLLVNSVSGTLADSTVRAQDRAVQVCPVGALLPKRHGFAVPIGQRRFDLVPIESEARPEMP